MLNKFFVLLLCVLQFGAVPAFAVDLDNCIEPRSLFDLSLNDPQRKIQRVATFPECPVPLNVSTNPENYFWAVKNFVPKETAKVLAIGDSWFAYPEEWPVVDPIDPPSNILTNLGTVSDQEPDNKKSRLPLSILSLSNSGEILSNMAGMARNNVVDQVDSIQRDVNVFETIGHCMRRIKRIDPNQHFSFVLISGGGNDLLSSARLHDLFKHTLYTNPNDPMSCIDKDQVTATLDHIMQSYEILVKYILALDPTTFVICHTYDQFYPRPVGATFGRTPVTGPLVTKGYGGWYYPVATTYGVVDPVQQRVISNWFLGQFASRLAQLAQKDEFHGHFHVLQTQGAMSDLAGHDKNPKTCSYYINEIHLGPRGYNYFARTFFNDMRKASGLASQVSQYPPDGWHVPSSTP